MEQAGEVQPSADGEEFLLGRQQVDIDTLIAGVHNPTLDLRVLYRRLGAVRRETIEADKKLSRAIDEKIYVEAEIRRQIQALEQAD